MAMILLALLPICAKFTRNTTAQDDAQREINRHVLHSVIGQIFEPLEKPGEEGERLPCSDGKLRHCYPILAAWIADHEEHVTL